LRADSHDAATLQLVQAMVGERGIDVLLIDGDHSYGGVKQDYAAYSPLVREGGLIAFHHIVPGREEYVGGVPSFWQSLSRASDVEEIVEDWEQGGFGIGLLRKML
jgi:predicted O-methyltransferase YrrM